jgi:tripartite ATP-independent transporter DctM subunit
MSAVAVAPPAPAAAAQALRRARAAEDSLLAGVLALLVTLPLLEATLRRLLHTGIPGSPALVQHLTLVATMLGAAVAARDGKLLRLFEFAALAPPPLPAVCRFAGHFGAACVALVLGLAGIELVRSEYAAGGTLALSMPIWLFQCAIPAGFGLIGLRLCARAAASPATRAAALLALAVLVGACALLRPAAPAGFIPLALALGAMALAGAPIFAVLGGAAALLAWQAGTPLAAVALEHYRMVVNPSLPAVPLFTLAGFVLAAGRAPQRLTRLFQALFGHLRGGVAVATVVVGALFTALTGGSGVTILALGGVLFPLLVRARYPEGDAVGLVTVSGSLGTLLAPCLPLILYAIVARVEIVQMFLGACLPALLMIGAVAVWGARRDRRAAASLPRFSAARARQALLVAKWDIALPVVIFLSLFGGFATPVEAAALTALYVVAVERSVHGSLRGWRELAAVFSDCGALVGGVLLILGVALGLTNYLVDAEWPSRATEWATQNIHSRALFLLSLNGLLLLAGCLMEIWSAIVVLPPLLVPIALAFGVDPVHLGVIFLANLELGYLTPLVGINLFYASARFDKPVLEVCRDVPPLLPILAASVLAITCLPQLSTWLPALLR